MNSFTLSLDETHPNIWRKEMSDYRSHKYRSLFWPLVLIGVGVVWLLVNLNVLSVASLNLLVNLWPLLLVGVGLDLIFGRRSPVVGAVIGVVMVAAVVALLLLAPSLNLPSVSATTQSRQLTVPLNQTESANMDLSLSAYSTSIYALPASSPNLFDATVFYNGNIDFSAQGSNGVMNIRLSPSGQFGWWFFQGLSGINQQWKIGLNPSALLTLNINAASGSSDIDLSGLKLSSLTMDAASGSINLRLPVSVQPYSVDYQGASGSADISLPANTSLTIHLHGASGSLSLNLPESTAVRIEVQDSGSGSINIPGSLNRTSGSGRDKTGAWESQGFASADQKLTIIVEDAGSGSININ
jgi:hypothetical protein